MTKEAIQQVIHFFNEEQKDAILCDTNCVVTAGAGSGKTSVLTYRFFRLVASGNAQVDEILTLTFTKAAAAEMYERIYTLFVAHSSDEYMKEQLEKFASSTISTIDSFCYSIVLSDMKRFGLSPDFLLDNDASVEIAQLCAYQTIEKMKGHPGMNFLTSNYAPQSLIDEVFVSLAIQNFYLGDTFIPDELTPLVHQYLQTNKEEAHTRLREVVSHLLVADGRGKVYLSNLELLTSLDRLLDDEHNLLSSLQEIESIKKIKKSSVKEEHVAAYNEMIVECRELLPLYISLVLSTDQKEHIQEVYEVFSFFHTLYVERKRESQILTYNDVAHMAHIILLENEEIRRSFSSSFRYIMVDEFQDTNPLQKEILYLLSTNEPVVKGESISPHALIKDKLFFVGDEKQSIYRFRGADVRVFKHLHEQIVASGGRLITLKKNYRSLSPLILLFNTLFKEVFSGAVEDFEASFTPLEEVKENNEIIPKASLVIIPYQEKGGNIDDEEDNSTDEEIVRKKEDSIDKEAPSGVELEAMYIADKIKEMTLTDEYLIEKDGEVKRPTYEDIAILIRTTSTQMHYEKELRIAQIPYTLSSVKSLFLEAPLNDLYIMLNLIIYPSDLSSYAAVLRSGFCNLDDNHVITLLSKAREDNQIFGEIESLPQLQQELYDKVKELYKELLIKSSVEPVSSLLHYLWYNSGYRNHLLISPRYSVYLEHFDYILELALHIQRKGGTLLTFLDFIRPRLGQSEAMGELEILNSSHSGVNIMTIHKSKGLEFPIVIIANAGGGAKGLRTPGVFYHEDGEFEIPIAHHVIEAGTSKNIVFEIEKKRIEKSESAELKRLLYVAFTRSKFHLLVTSYDNNRNLKDELIDKNFLSMIYFNSLNSEDAQYPINIEILEHSEVNSKARVDRSTIIQEALTNNGWYREAEREIIYSKRVVGVTSIDTHEHDIEKEITPLHILTSLKSDEILETYHLYSLFGTWTHALFEYGIHHLDKNFRLDEKVITKDIILSLAPSELSSFSLLDSEKSIMVQDILHMSTQFFQSSFYLSLITSHLISMESEVSFIARIVHNGELLVVHGIVDLLIEYDTHLLIVDFKTDKIIDPSLHKTQLDVYKSAIEMIYKKDVQAVLCYVREKDSERWL